jgi:hypothetical protein
MIYTVYKICEHESRQLLLVQSKGSDEFNLCVYNEHTGETVMRLNKPTLENFKTAIRAVETGMVDDLAF